MNMNRKGKQIQKRSVGSILSLTSVPITTDYDINIYVNEPAGNPKGHRKSDYSAKNLKLNLIG